jgi:hypothetical protein
MIGLALMAATTAAPSGNYNCLLNDVAAVSVQGGKADASMIEGLPADSLSFRLNFDGDSASVDWPNSPIQASGKQKILPTGPAAGMILTVAEGPCLFTEAACANMFNYAAQPDGSLKMLVTPTAVSYDSDRKTRFPFLVSMRGVCTPAKDAK